VQILLSVRVPSPVGHAIAGTAIAWISEVLAPPSADAPASVGTDRHSLVLACAIAAILPDVDIAFAMHRGWTHSIGATIGFAILAAFAARTWGWPVVRCTLLGGAAYGSHILLDWLGKDTAVPSGVMVFWPVSHTYFKSGLDVFAEISRRYWKPDEFILGNLLSAGREVAILGPVGAAAWWLNRWNQPRVG
jgi:LexA-binding, inner membrane-associated putative hydrolase